MKNNIQKIGFGGGCHWCTEAVFQSLKGVEDVSQGFIAATGNESSFSEAVIVNFNSQIISLEVLIEIHLRTHKSTSDHSMRNKYRSAIYTFSEEQRSEAKAILTGFQPEFSHQIITKVLPFANFKASEEFFQNYYYSNPEKPFCETYINPKLSLLLQEFSVHVNHNKVKSSAIL